MKLPHHLILAGVLALSLGTVAQAQTTDTALRVGIQPIVDVAPLFLGIAKGYFKDEHLSIEPVVAQGGGAVVAAVVSGDEQFGYGNVVSMMLAISHGLPLEAVVHGSQSVADGKHANVQILVPAASPIKTPRDLEGKILGVNALKTMSELIIKDDLTRRGVDVSKIKFTEIPNAEMAAALETGRVDATLEAEPYLSGAIKAGLRPLFEPYDEFAPKVTLAVYFAAHQYVVDHPDVVARFRRAMLRSLSYAIANPDEVRRIITTYTKIDPSTVSSMTLVGWSTQIDTPSVELLEKAMLKQGWMPSAVDLKAMLPPAAVTGK